MTIQHRRVLIMGAARPTGVGRAIVRQLAARGAKLVVSDSVGGDRSGGTGHVDAQFLEEIAREASEISGNPVPAIACDPLAAESVEELVSTAASHLGGIDVMCNNVGATGSALGDGPLMDVAEEAWGAGIAWNLTSSWLSVRAVAPVMREGGGGSIVLMSSYAGIDPTPRSGVVAVSRAAVNHMVRILARELGPDMIRINAVCPLAVRADLEGHEHLQNPGLAKLAEAAGLSLDQWLASSIPLGRGQSPDELAAVFEFLASESSSFVSGAVLPVAGGSPA